MELTTYQQEAGTDSLQAVEQNDQWSHSVVGHLTPLM